LPASVSAAGVVESGLLRLRANAAAAAAAAVSTEMPASLRQCGRCGLVGSSRRAADHNLWQQGDEVQREPGCGADRMFDPAGSTRPAPIRDAV
jgi:hypothetical protein